MRREPESDRPRRAVGVRDIAAQLGVSVGTVDRALHDKPGIKPDTRARVLAAAASLGYRPNLAARYLRSRRSIRIAIHLPARPSAFWDTLRDGIHEAAASLAPSLVLEERPYTSADHLATLLQGRTAGSSDGAIVAPGESDTVARRLDELTRRGFAVACVGDAPAGRSRLPSVAADAFSVGALAGELIGRFVPGGGRVAIVADCLTAHAQRERVRGFESGLSMMRERLTLADVIASDADAQATEVRVRELLQRHPRLKGIYISSGDAVAVLGAAGRDGRLASLAVVATDLAPELLPWIRSGKVAATISQRPLTQGQVALQLLYRYLQTRVTPTPCRQIVAPYAVMNSNLQIVLQRLEMARAASQRHEHASAPPPP